MTTGRPFVDSVLVSSPVNGANKLGMTQASLLHCFQADLWPQQSRSSWGEEATTHMSRPHFPFSASVPVFDIIVIPKLFPALPLPVLCHPENRCDHPTL